LTHSKENININKRLDLLRQLSLLQTATLAELHELATKLEECHYPPGAIIVQQGQAGRAFHIIENGLVLIWQNRADLQELIHECGPGEYIGETALLARGLHNVTVSAQTQVSTLALNATDFQHLLQPHFELKAEQERVQRNLALLEQMDSFNDLNISHLIQLARLAQRVFYPSHQVIINPTLEGQFFFIVESGQVEICAKEADQNKLVTRGRGQFFGDRDHLMDLPPGATVKTVSDSYLLRIRQDVNYTNILKNVSLRRLLQKQIRQFKQPTTTSATCACNASANSLSSF
jgi:cAMP-dependent protein kinase regulator